jgi:hypothetical protein
MKKFRARQTFRNLRLEHIAGSTDWVPQRSKDTLSFVKLVVRMDQSGKARPETATTDGAWRKSL